MGGARRERAQQRDPTDWKGTCRRRRGAGHSSDLRRPALIDGTVDNVIAFNGDVTINGKVDKTAIALNGRVTVTDGGVVGGDVRSRFAPRIEAGANVEGTSGRFDAGSFRAPFDVASRVASWVAISISTLVLGLAFVLFGPRVAEIGPSIARTARGPAIGAGTALFLGLPIFAVIAMITIVAIPLGLGLLLALALIYALGYVTSAVLVGRIVVGGPNRLVPALFAGWAILRIVALIPALGGIASLGAVVFGLGVLTVATWRARKPSTSAMPAVAQPSQASA